MKKDFPYFLIVTLKGLFMGAADAIPGVSGGTIAFITGIYEELIQTISNINLSLLKTLMKDGFKTFWTKLNGNFIFSLLIGIVISYVTFMKLAKYLIENHPILIWAFFFGLIVSSIYIVGKQITQWNLASIIALILGALFAYYITTLPSLSNNTSPWFLFFAAAIAICAMILPGISGSFILIVLGAYKTLSDSFSDFNIKNIVIFVFGAIVGLLSFSRILRWLFNHYRNITLATLTGFILGSLNKVWPWKLTIKVIISKTGEIISFSEVSKLGTLSIYQKSINNSENYRAVLEKSISPIKYSNMNDHIDSQLIPATILMLLGFLIISILEISTNKPEK